MISAPSGAGKSTLIKQLMASLPGLQFSVSHTTRPPRPGEKNGREYFFVSEARFRKMVGGRKFVEWARVHGNYYGTSRHELRAAERAGKDILLDIDVQGHGQVRSRLPGAVSIFILPPSLKALARRLRRRRSEPQSVDDKRLREARNEIRRWREYDYVVVNDRVERTCRALKAIVLAARYRRGNQRPAAQEISKTFGG